MSERTRKTFVFGLLIGSLIWAYFSFSGRKPSNSRPARQHTAAASAVANVSLPPAALSEQTVAEYEKKSWGKDPFYHRHKSAPQQTVPDKVKLHLLGILYREVNAQALINGRAVREGDTVAGYRIERIERDHVKISDGKKAVILRVEKERS
jgi:hypothetical protein